jgi:hypothetical protein
MTPEDAQNQREYVATSYANLQAKTIVKTKNRDAKVVYDNQKEAASEITRLFIEEDMDAVTLLALPQVGKTGVMVWLAYLMSTHVDDNTIIDCKNIFIITGMSDKDWLAQTKESVPDAFVKIYTRTGFSKLDNLEHVRNALIIIDECHIAVDEKNQLSKALSRADLTKATSLREKNIKLVQVSATPGYALHNARTRWGNDHGVVTLLQSEKYVGFRDFMDADRIMDTHAPNVDIFSEIESNIKSVFKTPKYHIFRINRKEKPKFDRMIAKNNWKCIEHNCKSRENIDDILKDEPAEHTFIIIKNFWRAGKRLEDTHIGIVYDEPAENPSCEVVAQSLAGRLCGNNKQLPSEQSPIIYCDLSSLEIYMKFYDNGGEFTSDYNSGKLSVSLDGVITTKDSFHDGDYSPPEPRSAYTISTSRDGTRVIFDTKEEAKAWATANLNYSSTFYNTYSAGGGPGMTHIKLRGKLTPLLTVEEAFASTRITIGANKAARIIPVSASIGWGVAHAARIMPVMSPTIKYIVIYKNQFLKTEIPMLNG